jgi:hypothetical protein
MCCLYGVGGEGYQRLGKNISQCRRAPNALLSTRTIGTTNLVVSGSHGTVGRTQRRHNWASVSVPMTPWQG